jgi:hypothetical protein
MNFLMSYLSSFKYRLDQIEALGLMHPDAYCRSEAPKGYS